MLLDDNPISSPLIPKFSLMALRNRGDSFGNGGFDWREPVLLFDDFDLFLEGR